MRVTARLCRHTCPPIHRRSSAELRVGQHLCMHVRNSMPVGPNSPTDIFGDAQRTFRCRMCQRARARYRAGSAVRSWRTRAPPVAAGTRTRRCPAPGGPARCSACALPHQTGPSNADPQLSADYSLLHCKHPYHSLKSEEMVRSSRTTHGCPACMVENRRDENWAGGSACLNDYVERCCMLACEVGQGIPQERLQCWHSQARATTGHAVCSRVDLAAAVQHFKDALHGALRSCEVGEGQLRLAVVQSQHMSLG